MSLLHNDIPKSSEAIVLNFYVFRAGIGKILCSLYTAVGKNLWIGVNNYVSTSYKSEMVYNPENRSQLYTSYPQSGALVWGVILQAFKKSIDHLSPYPHCLLRLLF